jgi:hypothetical protein
MLQDQQAEIVAIYKDSLRAKPTLDYYAYARANVLRRELPMPTGERPSHAGVGA